MGLDAPGGHGEATALIQGTDDLVMGKESESQTTELHFLLSLLMKSKPWTNSFINQLHYETSTVNTICWIASTSSSSYGKSERTAVWALLPVKIWQSLQRMEITSLLSFVFRTTLAKPPSREWRHFQIPLTQSVSLLWLLEMIPSRQIMLWPNYRVFWKSQAPNSGVELVGVAGRASRQAPPPASRSCASIL